MSKDSKTASLDLSEEVGATSIAGGTIDPADKQAPMGVRAKDLEKKTNPYIEKNKATSPKKFTLKGLREDVGDSSN